MAVYDCFMCDKKKIINTSNGLMGYVNIPECGQTFWSLCVCMCVCVWECLVKKRLNWWTLKKSYSSDTHTHTHSHNRSTCCMNLLIWIYKNTHHEFLDGWNSFFFLFVKIDEYIDEMIIYRIYVKMKKKNKND